MTQLTLSAKARRLYENALIIDNALGFEPELEVPYKWNVLQRYAEAKFTCVTLSVATDATDLVTALHYMAQQTARIKCEPDKYILVESVADILKAKQENKLAIGFMFQGTHPLAKDLNMIDTYYKLGVRSMILAYNIRNALGDGCAEPNDAGLSLLGKRWVEKMNQTGMLIDLSHTGYRTSMEVMEITKAPVIFSHSAIYSIHPHIRNLKDDQIKAVATTGGTIGINGISIWLGNDQASPQKYVEHIDYVVQLVGAKHVMLGTDLIYFPELVDSFLKSNAQVYPADYVQKIKPAAEWRCIQPEQIIEITELLVQRGYSDIDIKNILGENYMRVIKQVWQ